MKWKKEYSRIVKTYALFPIYANNEYRWLETVYIRQYRAVWNFAWKNDYFVAESDYLAYRKSRRDKE